MALVAEENKDDKPCFQEPVLQKDGKVLTEQESYILVLLEKTSMNKLWWECDGLAVLHL